MLEPIHPFLSAPTLLFVMTLRVASHTMGAVDNQCQGLPVTWSTCIQSTLDASQREECDASGKGREIEI